jgi:ribosomal protein L7/L12
MSEPNPEEQARQVREALFAGNKIQAIKFYREQTGVGLKDAKDAVEKLESELRAASPGQFAKSPAPRGCGAMVLGALGVVLWIWAR